jgi:hypothetical protein
MLKDDLPFDLALKLLISMDVYYEDAKPFLTLSGIRILV